MKKTLYIFIAALALVCVSCEKSHLNDNLYDSSVYIVNHGKQVTETFYDVQSSSSVNINTYCGGFYGGNPTVKLAIDETALKAYNTENEDSLKLLPPEYYSLDAATKTMTDKKAAFIVTFDCGKLKELSTKEDYSDLSEYAVPLTLTSDTEGIGDPRFSYIASALIVPKMSKMGFLLDKAGTSTVGLDDMTSDGDDYVLVYTVSTPTENKWDNGVAFTFNSSVDGLTYPTLPEGSYTVESSSESGFTPGVSEVTYTVKIDKSKLTDLFYSITAKVASEGDFTLIGDSLSVINLINARYYSQSDISIIDCNSYKNSPAVILDGLTSTIWEAAYNSSHTGTMVLPFYITMKLKEPVKVVGFSITRRTGKYVKDLRGGYMELSNDGVTFNKVSDYDYGTTDASTGPLYTSNMAETAQYLKLWITMSNRNNVASIAEFNLLTR